MNKRPLRHRRKEFAILGMGLKYSVYHNAWDLLINLELTINIRLIVQAAIC